MKSADFASQFTIRTERPHQLTIPIDDDAKAHPLNRGEITMFRKLTFALLATAALGAAALAPTSASAHGGGGGGGGSHGGYGSFGGHGGYHVGYRDFHRDYRRDWRYRGWGYGPGWCYYHPDQCNAE